MGHWTSLETPTGRVRAWRADPAIPAKGALVVIQEIFGVNGHIRDVVDKFAAHGYAAIAPAFFDHFEHDVQLGYDASGIERGRELITRLGLDRAIADVKAAVEVVQDVGQVGAVGYCWGGTVAYLANTRLGLPAVSYYGARTVPFLQEPLGASMLFHFGEHDASIPPEAVAAHRHLKPEAEIHVYPAGHGFNCNQRDDFDEASATLALERTLTFFEHHLR